VETIRSVKGLDHLSRRMGLAAGKLASIVNRNFDGTVSAVIPVKTGIQWEWMREGGSNDIA